MNFVLRAYLFLLKFGGTWDILLFGGCDLRVLCDSEFRGSDPHHAVLLIGMAARS